MNYQKITQAIIGKSIEIHCKLGPGLLESVYRSILALELEKAGLKVTKELPIPLTWDKLEFNETLQADLLVENKVIVELKSVEKITNVHKNQLLTYIKLADKRLGLLINFNEKFLTKGIVRIASPRR